MSRMQFMNIEIDNVTFDEALDEIRKLIKARNNSYVVTPNADHMIMLQEDEFFQKVYKEASLVITDGKPLIWISKFYKTPIKEKISGSDLFPRVCEMAAKEGYTMYFLGAAEGVAAKAKENLEKKYEGLNVVGTYSPPFGFEKDEKEIDKIVGMITDVHPDILIVGLGAPKQEKFAYTYRDRLNVPISFGLGASIDFEAGNIKRAPKWMSDIGLEWFYRMLKDPGRLVKRYLKDFKIFALAWKYRPKKRKAESK
ncbi:MAG: WecB/TagA/CpsF family glycosyltransferase [Clostridia bacterium]|nr:WecB/TagA/CpsF family glycosyltransferase [Clostridia bacterium]